MRTAGTLLLVLLAAAATGGAWAAADRHGADWCNCGDEDKPVCGMDQQTYLNECVMGCMGQKKRKDGACDPDCYPPSVEYKESEFDDWESTEPVCVSGLTYMNKAEAQYDGYPLKCMEPGVCTYNYNNEGKGFSYEPTTGGKGKSVKDAAANTNMPDANDAPYPYNEALTKALLYYDSQISGKIEPSYKRLAWRGDSCHSCQGKYDEDLSGGFYESGGSTLKLGVISAYTPAFLAAGALCFPDGYKNTNLSEDIKFKVKWAADYLINCHVDDYVFMGAMGNHTEDFDNFAPWEMYEDYSPKRPVGYCTKDQACSEIVGDAAAALAAASILLKEDNATWAANALDHAKQLYKFATEVEGTYVGAKDPALTVHWYLYGSDGYKDELAYAAAWLLKATGEQQYKKDAAKYFKEALEETPDANTQEAGNLKPITAVLMAELDPGNKLYTDEAETFFNRYLAVDGEITHTDCGLAYPYHWGAMTHGPNVAMLGMCYGKTNPNIDPAYKARLFNYGQHQVDYVLGDCGRSWMVGFGEGYPQFIHHEPSWNSYLDWKENDPLAEEVPGTNNPGPFTVDKTDRPLMWQKGKMDFEGSWFPQRHIAYGTMFGAPLLNDGLIMSRRDYTYAEPTTVYATGITGALAGLAEYYGQGPWSGELQEVNDVDFSTYL